jgi:hypothetical protein
VVTLARADDVIDAVILAKNIVATRNYQVKQQ